MGFKYTPIILAPMALVKLINDKLLKTPSRKPPPQFIARIMSGGPVGATICAPGMLIFGLITGVIGAVLGTYGGAAARQRLALMMGGYLPAALLEGGLAIGVSVIVLISMQ